MFPGILGCTRPSCPSVVLTRPQPRTFNNHEAYSSIYLCMHACMQSIPSKNCICICRSTHIYIYIYKRNTFTCHITIFLVCTVVCTFICLFVCRAENHASAGDDLSTVEKSPSCEVRSSFTQAVKAQLKYPLALPSLPATASSHLWKACTGQG